MLDFLTLSYIIRLYYIIRSLHGIYISYQFISWLFIKIYGYGIWILSYIPKPKLQLSDKTIYYEINSDDYIEIKELYT